MDNYRVVTYKEKIRIYIKLDNLIGKKHNELPTSVTNPRPMLMYQHCGTNDLMFGTLVRTVRIVSKLFYPTTLHSRDFLEQCGNIKNEH